MGSSLAKLIAVVLMLLASIGVRAENDINNHIDFDDNYIKAEFSPLCNAEGQFKLVLANSSNIPLLVEPTFFRSELFDPSNFGLKIRQTSSSKRIKMKAVPPQVDLPVDWYKLGVGGAVEHIIDLRTMTEGVLATDSSYTLVISKMIKAIKPEGEVVYVDLFTNKQLEQFTVKPECFQ